MTIVVVLGGAGVVGQAAVETLSHESDVSRVVVADQDLARARDVAGGITATQVTAAAVDARDPALLADLFAEADVVFVASGSPSNDPVVARAALDAGCSFVDVTDDADLIAAQVALSDEFAGRGLTGVSGMGASPGLLNLLALKAAHHLDEVHDLTLGVRMDVVGEVADEKLQLHHSVLRHWISRIDQPVSAVRAGAPTEVAMFSAADVTVGGEQGVGWTVRRPELLPLAAHLGISGDATSLLLGSPLSVAVLRDLASDLRDGWLTTEQAMEEAVAPSSRRRARATATRDDKASPGGLPHFFAQVTGAAAGATSRVTVAMNPPSGQSGASVAVPAVLALRQVLAGRIPAGVHRAESGVDLDMLFADLGAHCRPFGDSDEHISITHDHDLTGQATGLDPHTPDPAVGASTS